MKLAKFIDIHCPITSPPVRGCGLKRGSRLERLGVPGVTPRAGVWIETMSVAPALWMRPSHPPCGGVD